ncbi:MAG: hypothetical protein IIU28_05725, partial [Lachnospiraceae bacterium]|nr:hypothetical protein [Lachnospiraceae bacterium]
ESAYSISKNDKSTCPEKNTVLLSLWENLTIEKDLGRFFLGFSMRNDSYHREFQECQVADRKLPLSFYPFNMVSI